MSRHRQLIQSPPSNVVKLGGLIQEIVEGLSHRRITSAPPGTGFANIQITFFSSCEGFSTTSPERGLNRLMHGSCVNYWWPSSETPGHIVLSKCSNSGISQLYWHDVGVVKPFSA